MKIPKTKELYDTSHTLAAKYLEKTVYPYEILGLIDRIINEIGAELNEEYYEVNGNVYIARDASVAKSATIIGPAIIGHGCEIRCGAYIRENVIIGDGAVIGNSTEIKNSIIFDSAQLPHYNYVGDSVIGYKAHMGAGAIASNFRLDHANICLHSDEERIDTGRRKVGAFIGDGAEIGCGSVICPGASIAKGAVVYPLSCIVGALAHQ